MVGSRYSPPNPKRRADRTTWQREVVPLLERLDAHDTKLAASTIAVIRQALPSYGHVPDDALQASARRNSRNATKTLTARRLPGEEDLSSAAVAAGERARQGVPVHDALTACRISMHEIWEFLTEAAGRAGCSPAVTLELTQLMWALADAVSIRMATASRVMKVAERFGLVGVFRFRDLSLRVAVAAEDELGEVLVERYIEPLAVLGDRAAAIMQTVALYIEEGLNFKSTAQRLDVHQNTIRYRVVRFEELTQAHLDHPYSAFEVWWALQRTFIKDEITGGR